MAEERAHVDAGARRVIEALTQRSSRPDQPSISILPDRMNSRKPIPRYRNVC
jgi:hypothetical protein